MNKRHLLTISLITTLLIPSFLHAQEATDESIQNIRDAVKQKVDERLDSITQRKIGLVGQITDISGTQITTTSNQQNYTLITNEDTTYQRIPGRRPIAFTDLAIDDFILVKGTQETNATSITATAIQVIPEPTTPDRQILPGTITDITNGQLTILNENQEWTITTDQTTDYYTKTTTQTNEQDRDELIEGDNLIVIGLPVPDEDNELKSLIILHLPVQ